MQNGFSTTTHNFTKMNILITGANGQLGNEMRRVARTLDKDKFTFTDVADLDITDADAVAKMVVDGGFNIIVNCAAYTNVDKAEDDEATADKINNQAVANLAQAAKLADATLIHVSTDYVFDGTAYTPYIESDKAKPTGVYGLTKLAGEKSVIASGCKAIIIRTAWLYSIHGNNFVKTIRRVTGERDEINVVFDQIGSPTYAGDLADAIGHIIRSRAIDKTGIYHFTNEGVCSWYDFAIAIATLSGNKCKIHPVHSDEYPSRVKRPHYSVLDKAKFRATFAFEIPYWYDSLKKCINQL